MMKTIVFFVAFCLSLSVWARLGMTRQECLDKYGKPLWECRQYRGNTGIDLALYKVGKVDDSTIFLNVCYLDDKVELAYYCKLDNSDRRENFSSEEKEHILESNNCKSYSNLEISNDNNVEVNGYRMYYLMSAVQYYNKEIYMTYAICQKDSDGNPVFYSSADNGSFRYEVFFTLKLVKETQNIEREEFKKSNSIEKSKLKNVNF